MSARNYIRNKWCAVRASFHRLVRRRHRHEWFTIGTNGFYMSIEEECWYCSAKRHRVVKAENLGKNIEEWQDGPHPLANAGGEASQPEADHRQH